ncbi:hypothetical protein BGZ58_003903 [Dissophora ornata]|nr:hypothetical protein BGZ58_003903 [Dissophora ornata]
MTTPKIVLGTMIFGLDHTDGTKNMVRVRGVDNIRPFLDLFSARGHNEIDTARVYCEGDTELALGQLNPEKYKISTKVAPYVPRAHGDEFLKKTFRQSLAALQLQKVDIFYLHAPDYSTPFEETIKAVDDLYREGLFERFGLSNFAAWQVTLIHQLCKQHGYILPSVYQGMYNAIVRGVASELLPCLKALGIAFYAFNPIADGFLSGKYNFDTEVGSGRFDEKNFFGKLYRQRFWSGQYFEAINMVEKVAKEHNITLIESAFR